MIPRTKVVTMLAVCLALGIVLSGCGSGTPAPMLTPSGTQAIDAGQTLTITSQENVTWSLSGLGSLTGQTATSVTYNAPAVGSFVAPRGKGSSAAARFAAGADPAVMITATSTASTSKVTTLTLNLAEPPAITTSSPLPNGVVGTAYNQTIAVTGGAGTLTFTTTTGTLPAGLMLSSSGTISGTPTAVGTSNFTVKVTDSSVGSAGPLSATQSYSITVNQAPAITSASSITFTVGVAGTFTVTTTGTPTPSLTESGTLPTGVSFTDNGNGTGTLSGTPAAGTAANYAIMFTASNGIGTAATQNFTLTVGQPPAITSASSTTFTVGTASTFTVTTTGFPTPTLTATGTLPNGVTFTDNGNGTGKLSGTPAAGTGGTYAITLKAHNGIGSDATQSFTLTVDQTPAITSANKITFTVSTAGTFTVTTSGFPTPSITETGTLPNGVTFADNGNGTGTLAGVPAPGTVGNYPITFTPSNGVGSPAGQSFTLTVGQAPAFTSGTTTTFTVGAAGTFSVTTSGFPAPSLTESSALPSGVTFVDNGNGTGTLSGTPAAGTGKQYSVTFAASNGVGSNATQNFTLTVNEAPSFTSANNATFSVGAAGTFTVTTKGFPAPSIGEAGTLPNGVTFTDNGNGTGTLSGTPASGTAGSYTITFTATNSVSSTPQTFTLTVNTAPVITSANNATFTVGTNGSFSITATGTPTPSIAESGALPNGVTFTGGTGTATLSGTPAANTGGTYTITFTAHNGVGTDATQTFTLTVDQAPAITSTSSTTFTEGVSGSFTVMTTGFPNAAITELGTLPSGVTFTDNGNGTGTLSGTPAAGSSTASPYTITFTANNGVGTPATQTFTLTVNTAPVFTSGTSTTFTVGTPGTFTITASGTPSPTVTESGTLPNGVTFTGGTGSGTLSGTPAAGTGTTYSITFTATSSSGTTHQTFTLTVDEAPSITSNNSTSFTIGTAGSFTVTTKGFPTPTLSDGSATLPSGVSFTDNGNGTGTLSGTPAAGTAGNYSITFTASNGVGSNGTQNFTLTVAAAALCTTTGGQEALLTGQYAFLLKGFDNGTGTGETSPEPALVGGVLTFNGVAHNGLITAGAIDMNLNSGFDAANGGNPFTVTSGTYGVGSDHRGCMAITTSAGTQHYAFSVGNISGTPAVASTGHMIDFDASGPFTAGVLRKQTTSAFTTSQVTGNYAFGVSSVQNTASCNGSGTSQVCGGNFGVVGVIDLSSGTVTGGEVDFNQSGQLDGNSANTNWPASPITLLNGGSYAISSTSGRGTLTFTPNVTGSNTVNTVIYVVSSTDFLVLGADSQITNNAFAGEAVKQSGTLSGNPLSGNYVGYQSAPSGTQGASRVSLLLITPSGSSITGTQLRNDDGTFQQQNISGVTYTVSSTGRMTITQGGGGSGPIFYLANSSEIFALSGGNSADSGVFQSQNATSASGMFAFGNIDPGSSNVGANSGVVTLSAGSISGTSDDNSSGGGGPQPGGSITATYSIDGTGLGHIPANCTPGTNCQLVFYVITSTKAVLMDLQHSNGSGQADPKLQPADQ